VLIKASVIEIYCVILSKRRGDCLSGYFVGEYIVNKFCIHK
jgi:hypothetical protein